MVRSKYTSQAHVTEENKETMAEMINAADYYMLQKRALSFLF